MGNTESKIQPDNLEIRKFSHFPQADVKEWSAYFKTHFPKGAMTEADFESVFSQLFCFGNCMKFSKRLFKTINISQNGLVDFNELLIAFSILAKGSDYEKLRWIFRFYDNDNDGFINRKEMTEGVHDLLMMSRGTVDNLDDGICENNDILKILSTPNNEDISVNTFIEASEIVDEIFEDLENRSGFLTFTDFERLGELKVENFKKISIFKE